MSLHTRSQRKQLKGIQKRIENDRKTIDTVQKSIPFQRMFRDGTCRVTDRYYTRTIRFEDINYQLSGKDGQDAVFRAWSSLLNFFDPSVHLQLSFLKQKAGKKQREQEVCLPKRQDGFDSIRQEYSQMLKKQLSYGKNRRTRSMALTFGIEAESMQQAGPRLHQLERTILDHLRRMGADAAALDGMERLQLIRDMFHPEEPEQLEWNWKDLAETGLSEKDWIAPTCLSFSNSRTVQIGGIYGALSFLSITAPELGDRALTRFLENDSSQIITMHLQSVDQEEAIRIVKRIITELDRAKIDEQKKAIRSGYDMDILPSDLVYYGKDAKTLLKELMNNNERMFLMTLLIMNTGKTPQELETNVLQTKSAAQECHCSLRRLDFQQENALMSSLPLAQNLISIRRGLTTSSSAIFLPFTSYELFQKKPEALYYGRNAISDTMIRVDRKKLKNPNGLILGSSGSGKSFAAKREITNAFLVTEDDIIICDPEAEYEPLVRRLQGQCIQISFSSSQHVNPMDINPNYSEEDNPIALKADFILSLCELVMGEERGLLPVEKTVIDRCVYRVYRQYFEDPKPEKMPILEDLYRELLKQTEPEARHVASALEIYVKGSLNLFNHRTNVEIQNRLVCYDIKDLGKQVKKIGMLIIQDQVWGRVTANRTVGRSTRYYMDEIHLLLREKQTAAYSVEIWKRFRKWGGIPTGITQNVKVRPDRALCKAV